MPPTIQKLVDDCRSHGTLTFIVDNLDSFPAVLGDIIRDRNGVDVLASGVGLFAYLADLVEKSIDEGMRAWNAIYQGYPGHPHTDLFGPYFDVCRTRLLWINAVDQLDAPPVAKAEITLNICLRWYMVTMELVRKVLVFAGYCRSRVVGAPMNLPRFLFQEDGDPGKLLDTWGPTTRSRPILRYYRSDLRHAIAHGNVIMALPELIDIRLANDERSAITLKRHILKEEDITQATHTLLADLQANVEPLYQMIRVFFVLFTTVQNQNIDTIKKYLGTTFNDSLILAMVNVIQSDPDGMRDWE